MKQDKNSVGTLVITGGDTARTSRYVSQAEKAAVRAEQSAAAAEAWAVGESGGIPVGSTDETFHNNARHFAEHAAASAASTQIARTAAESAANAAQSAKDDAEAAAQSVVGSAAQISQNASDISDIKSDLNAKQNAPSSAGTAGQVLGLNNSLQPVWVNNGGGGGGGAVDDVQINGTSIVSSGVANIPLGDNTVGAVLVDRGGGMGININPQTGRIYLQKASDAELKRQVQGYKVVTPTTIGTATFYGLATAAGDTTQSASSNPVGTYTDDAKAAIRSMLGITIYNGGVT